MAQVQLVCCANYFGSFATCGLQVRLDRRCNSSDEFNLEVLCCWIWFGLRTMACVCIYICIYAYTHLHICRKYTYVCESVFTQAKHIPKYIYIYTYVCVLSVYIHLNMYIRVYIYIEYIRVPLCGRYCTSPAAASLDWHKIIHVFCVVPLNWWRHGDHIVTT